MLIAAGEIAGELLLMGNLDPQGIDKPCERAALIAFADETCAGKTGQTWQAEIFASGKTEHEAMLFPIFGEKANAGVDGVAR